MSTSLSQVITEITNANDQMNFMLANLPAPIPNEGALQSALAGGITLLRQTQTELLMYTSTTTAELNSALADINTGNYSDATLKLQKANADAAIIRLGIGNAATQFAALQRPIASASGALNMMTNNLMGQFSSLQMQLQNARNQVDYYTKQKWHYLALGPFGLVSLGVTLTNINEWTRKANTCQFEVSNLNNQIRAAQNALSAVQNAQSAYSNASAALSCLTNTMDVLSADISVITTDLASPAPATAKLYVTAALNEVQLLATEAS